MTPAAGVAPLAGFDRGDPYNAAVEGEGNIRVRVIATSIGPLMSLLSIADSVTKAGTSRIAIAGSTADILLISIATW